MDLKFYFPLTVFVTFMTNTHEMKKIMRKTFNVFFKAV